MRYSSGSKLDRLKASLGEIYRASAKNSRIMLSERQRDISLLTDKLLHKAIDELLRTISTYFILSEEAKDQLDFREFENYAWIVDPLDGTLNYSRSIPISCISIALWKMQQPIAGVIYDFNHDETFVCVTEPSEISEKTGAWLNETPITVSNVQNKNKAVLCTGFPSWRSYQTSNLMDFVKKIQDWKKVRLIGSATLSLAWVACGRADAYIEEDIRIWDVAAGLALVKAAGGEIYVKASERKNFVTAIATNGKIPLQELI